jgi:hypothetical protein
MVVLTSVADLDPGSGAFLTPGSVIRNRFFPDPGSQTRIFESLLTTVKSPNFVTAHYFVTAADNFCEALI